MEFLGAISWIRVVIRSFAASEIGLAVAILSLFASPSVVSQNLVSGQTLQAPRMQRQLASGLDPNKWNAHKWLGEYLVVFHQGMATAPSFGLYDAGDQARMTAALSFPQTTGISIGDVTVDEYGNSYVTGGAMSDSGALAQLIEKFDINGKSLSVIRTNPFVAQQVCTTGDGTVWALGFDRDVEAKKGDYAILRRFDFSRGELNAILQRSLVSSNFMGGHHHAFLVCNTKTVGVYLPVDNLWFEADAEGHNPSLRHLPPLPSKAVITGNALTSSGTFFITVADRSSAGGDS